MRGSAPAIARRSASVAVEAAGHYHRPVIEFRWPPGWEVLELNPAHVATAPRCRPTSGKDRRDRFGGDHRAGVRRPGTTGGSHAAAAGRDRGVGGPSPSADRGACGDEESVAGPTRPRVSRVDHGAAEVLATKIGRLIAAELADPARVRALGPSRLIRFARAREVRLRREFAERLVAAAREALPVADAAVARRVLAADVALLADLDIQITAAETELAALIPPSPFSTLTTVPGWGMVEWPNYAAALGDPNRRPGRSRSIEPPGCLRCSTNRPVNAAMERSPRRQRGAAPSIDRSRYGSVLQDPAAKTYASGPEITGQARRGHRLRPGPSCHPHRLRAGARPRQLRPSTLELKAQPPGFPRSRPSAPATSTGAPCAAEQTLRRKEEQRTPFTTSALSARLEPTKGRIRCRSRYGGLQGYAGSSLAPGPSPHRSPNDAR